VGTSFHCSTCPTLFAFDRVTGVLKWSAVVDALSGPGPSIANGLVYVRSGGGGHAGDLIALDEQTGNEVWRSSIGTGFDRAIPAIASGTIYVASGFNIYAVDAVDGTPVWPTPAPAVASGNCGLAATIAYSIFAVANDMIFIKSNNACGVAKVYALSTADGSLLWDLLSRGVDTSTPAVANGWLYFVLLDTSTNRGTLYAYSPQ
jgi:outer membrane protein assembly factor BamB